jgi:adenylate kinase family enzyme
LNKVTIAFTGPPCAGKSTLAAEVARQLGLPHLSMDATRQRLLPDAAHTRADREVAYRAMEWAAEMLPDVVLDAPYGHDEDYAGLVRLGAVVIECRVSPETAVRRFRERGPDAVRKDLTEDVVRQMVEEYHYRGGALVIDTERVSAAESVDRVLSVLQPRRGDRD